MCSIALYELNANLPYNWKIAIYTQFAMIGTSLIIFVFLPESTCTLPIPVSTLTPRVACVKRKDRTRSEDTRV